MSNSTDTIAILDLGTRRLPFCANTLQWRVYGHEKLKGRGTPQIDVFRVLMRRGTLQRQAWPRLRGSETILLSF